MERRNRALGPVEACLFMRAIIGHGDSEVHMDIHPVGKDCAIK